MGHATRPALFTCGIVLTGLRALLVGAAGGLVGIAVAVGLAIASAEARGDDGIPLAILAVVVGLFAIGLCLYELTLLAVCAGAWLGLRPCVWTLLAVSALGVGLPVPGLLKTPIAVVTLVGCIQWLERPGADAAGSLEPAPGDPLAAPRPA